MFQMGQFISDPFHVNNGVRQGVFHHLICSMCIWMISANHSIVVKLAVCLVK